jgi:hypothetical protein
MENQSSTTILHRLLTDTASPLQVSELLCPDCGKPGIKAATVALAPEKSNASIADHATATSASLRFRISSTLPQRFWKR